MSKRYKTGSGHGGGAIWLIIYADWVTNLTLFFILLFYSAMMGAENGSTVDEMNQVVQNISRASYDDPYREQKELKEEANRILNLDVTKRKKLRDFAEVVVTRDEVRITILEEKMFGKDDAHINDDVKPALDKIAIAVISKFSNKVIVEGHTSDTQMHKDIPASMHPWEVAIARSNGFGPYQSNWELSGARATQVIAYFEKYKLVLPDRIVARAYGPSAPIYPNDSEEHRAKNRRIEIRIRRKQ